MFDGTTILDVTVNVDGNGQPALLNNDRLTFRGMVDTQTGFVFSPIRTASYRGLTFRLVPRKKGNGDRVEVKGSLHKFHNNGQHNADQYTVSDLLLTLDQLARDFGFDLFNTEINNIEFGVNLILPFPVSRVLDNLICYKNQPFAVDSHSPIPYYVCHRQRYSVKIYDKGKQKGLNYYLLRFEIRVRKMEYFNGTGVRLDTLADLLNVANYEPLGALLVDTFNEILFDDPAIKTANLTPDEQRIYQDGRNPRFWQTPDNLTRQQDNAHRQRLSRTKRSYRALFDQHGGNWPGEVAALIGQTWAQLTAVDDDLLTRINDHRARWQNLSKLDIPPQLPELTANIPNPQPSGETARRPGCHKLTGSVSDVSGNLPGSTCHKLTNIPPPICHKLTDPSDTDLSQINPLYSGVHCDKGKPDQLPEPGAVVCPVTGVTIERPRRGQRFVSAAMLRNDDALLMRLQDKSKQYAKGSKENQFDRAAHNARNRNSNERNNLARRLRRVLDTPGLFSPAEVVRLNDEQRAALNYWQGTPYEVRL